MASHPLDSLEENTSVQDGNVNGQTLGKIGKEEDSGKKSQNIMKIKLVRKKKQKKKRRKMSYKEYIFKILKNVHPDIGVSGKSMEVINSLINSVFEEIAEESSRLAKHQGNVTITAHEIRTAVELILPGELAKRAVQEGNKAVAHLASSSSSNS